MDVLSFPEAVGRRIRRKREIMGMQQRAVADAILMAPSQYSRLEKGDYGSIRFDQLQRLAETLQVSADYFLFLTDDVGEIPPERCQDEALAVAGVTPHPAPTLSEEGSHA